MWQAVTSALVASQNLMVSKTLLLKASHTLITGQGGIKLVLTFQVFPCWLTFMVLEGVLLAVWCVCVGS